MKKQYYKARLKTNAFDASHYSLTHYFAKKRNIPASIDMSLLDTVEHPIFLALRFLETRVIIEILDILIYMIFKRK